MPAAPQSGYAAFNQLRTLAVDLAWRTLQSEPARNRSERPSGVYSGWVQRPPAGYQKTAVFRHSSGIMSPLVRVTSLNQLSLMR